MSRMSLLLIFLELVLWLNWLLIHIHSYYKADTTTFSLLWCKKEEQNAELTYGSCTCDVDMCELSCRPVRSEDDTLTGVPRCSRMLTFRSRSAPGTCRGGAFPKDQRLESYSRQQQNIFSQSRMNSFCHKTIPGLYLLTLWNLKCLMGFISLCYPEYGTERAAESVLTWTNLCVLLVLSVKVMPHPGFLVVVLRQQLLLCPLGSCCASAGPLHLDVLSLFPLMHGWLPVTITTTEEQNYWYLRTVLILGWKSFVVSDWLKSEVHQPHKCNWVKYFLTVFCNLNTWLESWKRHFYCLEKAVKFLCGLGPVNLYIMT